MKEIKRIKKGDWTLVQSWYVDDMGLKKNALNLIKSENGIDKHYPFIAPLRVSTKSTNEPYDGDDISPYTDEEYNEMINECKRYMK